MKHLFIIIAVFMMASNIQAQWHTVYVTDTEGVPIVPVISIFQYQKVIGTASYTETSPEFECSFLLFRRANSFSIGIYPLNGDNRVTFKEETCQEVRIRDSQGRVFYFQADLTKDGRFKFKVSDIIKHILDKPGEYTFESDTSTQDGIHVQGYRFKFTVSY